MRRSLSSLLYACLVAFASMFAGLSAAQDPILTTIESYTDALQSGDVATLQEILGGRLYQKRRALLEDNTEYPDWLRDYYSGAQFSSSISDQRSDTYPSGTVVELVVVLASGESARVNLVMQATADGAGWQIIDELR